MGEKRERILEVAAIVSATAAVASAIFVGYQAYLFREALDDPFQANLQARQIEACESFFLANRKWMFKRDLPLVTSGTRVHLSEPTMVEVFPVAGFKPEVLIEEYQSTLKVLVDEVALASGRLRALSAPSEDLITNAGWALTIDYYAQLDKMKVWLDLSSRGMMEKSEHDALFAKVDEKWEQSRVNKGVRTYEEEVEPLVTLCRDRMTGSSPGLF